MQVNGIKDIRFGTAKQTINPSHQYSYDGTNDTVVHVGHFIDYLKATGND